MIILSQKLVNRILEFFVLNPRFDSQKTEIEIEIAEPFNETKEFVIDLCSTSIENLSLLEICILETVLSSDGLRIESEDWLLDLILFYHLMLIVHHFYEILKLNF
jgi:hypothetical protein